LSNAAKKQLKSWLREDYRLYDHFKEKFKADLTRFGLGRMKFELTRLRSANAEVEKTCVKERVPSSRLGGIYKLWGKDLVGYRFEIMHFTWVSVP
jgi:hypothetical protein